MIRKLFAIPALALAAAVTTASLATARTTPTVDPLAVGYLMGRGYTAAQIRAWTVGVCSHEIKPAACYGPAHGARPTTHTHPDVDPLAVGYLTSRGLSPSEVRAWTVGACSYAAKNDSCYAMLDRNVAPGVSAQRAVTVTDGRSPDTKDAAVGAQEMTSVILRNSSRFNWGDAGIGAAGGFGIATLVGGLTLFVRSERQRRIVL